MRAFARAERPARRWYADRALIVAFTLDTAIAAVDAVTKTVLIGVVVVGPLVAAARTPPRRTAAIGGYAFLLAVYEGVPHGIFGSSDHVARCAAIGLTASLSVWVAWLRDRREAAQRHIVLLAEAGALLSASLDDVATMRDVAELVTTDLYDWCAVDLLEPDGGLRPIALAHRDGRHDALEQLQESWARAAHGRPAVAEVIRSGRARVYRAPERLLPATPDARDRDALRALGMASAMVVPM